MTDDPFPTDGVILSHIRVPDCHAAYRVLSGRGADFLTPPYEWGAETRCFFRDPDGNLLEISSVA